MIMSTWPSTLRILMLRKNRISTLFKGNLLLAYVFSRWLSSIYDHAHVLESDLVWYQGLDLLHHLEEKEELFTLLPGEHCNHIGKSHHLRGHELPYFLLLLRPSVVFLRNSASSFHWLSSSIFSCLFVCRPSRIVTSPLISTIWRFRPYKPYIFCEDMILATCQCHSLLSWAQFTVV